MMGYSFGTGLGGWPWMVGGLIVLVVLVVLVMWAIGRRAVPWDVIGNSSLLARRQVDDAVLFSHYLPLGAVRV